MNNLISIYTRYIACSLLTIGISEKLKGISVMGTFNR